LGNLLETNTAAYFTTAPTTKKKLKMKRFFDINNCCFLFPGMIKQKGMIFVCQIVFNVAGLALDLGTVRCFNQIDSETNTLAYFAAVQVTMKKYIKV
jgi:hypothetical protein